MFEHSVKVPRLYKFACKVVKQVKEEGASLKDRIYQVKHSNLKAVYALAAEVLKKANVLDYLIRSTQILVKENRLDPWLARVLITELLWGKKRLPNQNKPCQTIMNYQKELTDCLATCIDDVLPKHTKKATKPRYVRVNTLKLTVLEAVDIFRDDGWTLLRCGDNSDYGSYLATVASLSSDHFIVDIHVKDLLVFPPNTQFYQHSLYLNGNIVLQDKSSCLAPLLLSPAPKSSVLDMCSAPGMKASQLAAIIGIEGTVYAVERDERRFQTLSKLMKWMSAENIKCINKDVLTITEKDFPDIEYILVDPSCSGSGMMDRLEFESPESKCNKSRLESLAGFQITILRHALNNFSNAKRVIYSTCSLYPEENESVVQQVIRSINNFKLVDLRGKMKSKWFNFGSNDFGEIGNRCLYAKPEDDLTNGFFVALFERLDVGEINDFFVKRVKRCSECVTVEDEQKNEINNDSNKQRKRKKNAEENSIATTNNNAENKKTNKSKEKTAQNAHELEYNTAENKNKKTKRSKKRTVDNTDEIEYNKAKNKYKKTKKTKVKTEDYTDETENNVAETVDFEKSQDSNRKKKKKLNKSKNIEDNSKVEENTKVSEDTNKENEQQKCIKKNKRDEIQPETKKSTQNVLDLEENNEPKLKKKKKSYKNNKLDATFTEDDIEENYKPKKKKSKHNVVTLNVEVTKAKRGNYEDDISLNKTKKRKKKHLEEN